MRIDPFDSFDRVVVRDDEATALEEARAFRGAFGPPGYVAGVLGAYADAGVEEIVVRFAATANQRDQLHQFRGVLA